MHDFEASLNHWLSVAIFICSNPVSNSLLKAMLWIIKYFMFSEENKAIETNIESTDTDCCLCLK